MDRIEQPQGMQLRKTKRREKGLIGVEADLAPGRIGRVHQLEDGLEDVAEIRVVFLFQGGDLAGQGFHREGHAPQFHEGADHGHAHVDGLRTVEHSGCHDGAMFGEGIRQFAQSAVSTINGSLVEVARYKATGQLPQPGQAESGIIKYLRNALLLEIR